MLPEGCCFIRITHDPTRRWVETAVDSVDPLCLLPPLLQAIGCCYGTGPISGSSSADAPFDGGGPGESRFCLKQKLDLVPSNYLSFKYLYGGWVTPVYGGTLPRTVCAFVL